jgi:hypothetical protein
MALPELIGSGLSAKASDLAVFSSKVGALAGFVSFGEEAFSCFIATV